MGCEDRNSNPKRRNKPQDRLSSYTGMVCSFSYSYQCFYYDEASAFSTPHALALLSPVFIILKYRFNKTILPKVDTQQESSHLLQCLQDAQSELLTCLSLSRQAYSCLKYSSNSLITLTSVHNVQGCSSSTNCTNWGIPTALRESFH